MSKQEQKKAKGCEGDATVNIEYAGIAALMWWPAKGKKPERAEMWLVNVGATSFGKRRRSPHFASVMVNATRHVKGPAPDAITTQANGTDVENAIWRLRPTTKIFFSSDIKGQVFRPDFTELSDEELKDLPDTEDEAKNLAWLPEITSLAESATLARKPKLTAVVKDLRGNVEARPTGFTKEFSYTFNERREPLEPADRVIIGRINQVMTYREKFKIRLTTPKRTITLLHNREDESCAPTSVVVSNLCLCPDKGPGDHFFSYYDLLARTGRKPEITHKKRPDGVNPLVDPENCFQSVFRFI